MIIFDPKDHTLGPSFMALIWRGRKLLAFETIKNNENQNVRL